jgi:hypothetical protein
VRFVEWSDSAQSAAAPAGLFAEPTAVSVEAMVFVNARDAYGNGNGVVLALTGNWQQHLVLVDDEWQGLTAVGGQATVAANTSLAPLFAPDQWHFVKLALDGSGYSITIDASTQSLSAPADLALWAGATPQVQLGGFNGWVAEVVVRAGP